MGRAACFTLTFTATAQVLLLKCIPIRRGKCTGALEITPLATLWPFKRLMGYDVLYPMGFDSFGMPAENAAISEATALTTSRTQHGFHHPTDQRMGFFYDWHRPSKS